MSKTSPTNPGSFHCQTQLEKSQISELSAVRTTVPPEICHAVFPAGFGVGSQQSLIFVRCNNYIGESCDDLLGATARNSVCRSSTCSQNFARVSARLFFNFAGARKGIKNGGQNWGP